MSKSSKDSETHNTTGGLFSLAPVNDERIYVCIS